MINSEHWSSITRNHNQTQINSLHLDYLGMGTSSSKAEVQDAAPKMPTWSQSEVASSESEPQQIPPGQHGNVFSWTDVKEIIDNNRLDLIRRKPSERLVYKAWCKDIVAAYGSITAYMCAECLRWTPLPSSCAESGPLFHVVNPTPFGNAETSRFCATTGRMDLSSQRSRT